jgi:hypothetical protein
MATRMDAALGSGGSGEKASKMLIDDHCSSLIVKFSIQFLLILLSNMEIFKCRICSSTCWLQLCLQALLPNPTGLRDTR